MFDYVLRLLLLTVILISANINLVTDNSIYECIAKVAGASAGIIVFTECTYYKYLLA